jgi:hypothetical protein
VIIDERIPVDIKTRQPVFGACLDPHEMWVALIEKAYAKLHGCYGNLISGYIDEGIQELTGMQPEKILVRNEKTGVFPHKMIEQHYGGKNGFWKFLNDRDEDGCLMGCSIKGYGKEGQLILDGQPTGLIMNHAYSISDIMEIKDKYDPQKPIRLMRLRNPWGKGEWNGAWSDGSKEMEDHRDSIDEYIQTLDVDERFDLGADDGTFFMRFADWRDNFSSLFVNIDFPDRWTGVRFKTAWTKAACGGLPTSMEREVLEKYAQNPQILIKPAKETELMFSMT